MEALRQPYEVRRTDRRDGDAAQPATPPAYFVLDVANDPHALAALTCYRIVCEGHLPELSNALFALEQELRAGRRDGPALAALRTPL